MEPFDLIRANLRSVIGLIFKILGVGPILTPLYLENGRTQGKSVNILPTAHNTNNRKKKPT